MCTHFLLFLTKTQLFLMLWLLRRSWLCCFWGFSFENANELHQISFTNFDDSLLQKLQWPFPGSPKRSVGLTRQSSVYQCLISKGLSKKCEGNFFRFMKTDVLVLRWEIQIQMWFTERNTPVLKHFRAVLSTKTLPVTPINAAWASLLCSFLCSLFQMHLKMKREGRLHSRMS